MNVLRSLLDQLGDLDGYPVELRVSMDYGGRSLATTQRLLEVEQMELDEAIFAVPEDYRQVPNPLAGLGDGMVPAEGGP